MTVPEHTIDPARDCDAAHSGPDGVPADAGRTDEQRRAVTPRKWTKADAGRLRSAIDSAWLRLRLYSMPELVAQFRAHLAADRAAIACAGIRELRNIAAERAIENWKTAAHFAAHPAIYGASTPEMIERFETLAKEEERATERADRLIARVETEGLPPELATYDPTEAA